MSIINPSSFNDKVEQQILSKNGFGITKVFGLSSINTINYDSEAYPEIVNVIKEGKSSSLPFAIKGSYHLLEIMKFTDQINNNYIVTIYDSLELWQDPEIIDIFKLDD